MRKIVAILLLTIYSVCSTGATIYMHHCGKRTLISVLDEEKVSHDQCPLCTEHHHNQEHSEQNASCCENKDMCQDVQLELKNDTDQQQSSLQQLFSFTPAVVIIPWIISFLEQRLDQDVKWRSSAEELQFAYVDPVYILNCNFRI
ncbi:hypothetical protein GQF61_03975 [Sphingobacterium sp. DK4209]|uniref:DUF2946 domain-containing protein n=1 Tax=Sphingobacterium zhuxiongii TaxID=2662364 RepID=A0A5Q0Q7V0_9SPHI|nr:MULTISPECIES: hypothetical protein [unclassified Sphingobacterium]MVZ64996.1 hypothetical protein [Sphingobacterium sp. DK4209]QGA25334.1 hypothetical protein GFH32_02930 [Sphingobacterium sp. dk4302]